MKIKAKHFEQIKELVNFDVIESADDMQRNLEHIAEIIEKVAEYNKSEWFVIDQK